MTGWTVEYDGDDFARFFRSLSEYEQAVLAAATDHVLKVHGIDVCAGEWGKPLGQGLYEFRVRRSLQAILSAAGLDHTASPARIAACSYVCSARSYGDLIVLLYHDYNKKRDPSAKRQQKEIATARKLHEAWKRRR